MSPAGPEDKAREEIDRLLDTAGWHVCDFGGTINFKSSVREWSDKLGVKINSLTVRPMSNKWSSCSSNGNLSFNTELLGLDKELCDYVIVHELLLFHVPNHGKLWKSLMMAHLGEYQQLENRLQEISR